jgi:hypothetical protein
VLGGTKMGDSLTGWWQLNRFLRKYKGKWHELFTG